MAETLLATTRSTDLCFRIGGDEFLVLLPQQSLSDAGNWADRFRAAVAARSFAHNDVRMDVTVSVGLAAYGPPAATPDRLLDAADAALYAAKRDGRNAVRRSA